MNLAYCRAADRRDFTSFVLELIVYPAIFALWKWREEVKVEMKPAEIPG